jgi:nicotinamide mononucleotide transporter
MNLLSLFDINTTFFTLLNYPMSYLEFFGTIFTGWSVYLSAKNKVISWPIGLVGVVLYGFLFYQIQLYSDLFEQIYYLLTGFWGWWLWTHPQGSQVDSNKELKVSFATKKFNLIGLISVFLLTISLSYFMSNIHLIFPVLFPIAASFPFMDALTTAMSFVANVYLAKRKIENWYLWIIVDIIGVFLYYQKGVIFLSLLYFFFLINAFKGVYDWTKTQKSYAKKV